MKRNLDELKVIAGSYPEAKAFWLERLADAPMGDLLPVDHPKGGPGQSRFHVDLPERLAERLIAMSGQSDQRLHLILAASLLGLVHKITSKEALSIGTPVYARENQENLLNTALPLSAVIDGQTSLKHLILATRDWVKNAAPHQNYPIEVLASQLGMDPHASPFPLFNLGLVLENVQCADHLAGLAMDFRFDLKRDGRCLAGRCHFHSGRYREQTARNLVQWWMTLLEETLFQPDRPLSQVSLAGQDLDFLQAINPKPCSWPQDETLASLLVQAETRFPQRTALSHQGRTLTYAELAQRSNRLAHRLRDAGVTRETPVALVCEKSMHMIVAMVAVLKAGGCYVPIDPRYPRERIAYTLEDCAAPVVLATRGCRDLADHPNILVLDDDNQERWPDHPPRIGVQPQDAAYVIYTSGTTGKPKGVLLEHRNLVRLFFNDAFPFHFDEHDVWTMFHGYCFDFSVWEMYGALLRGGKLVIVDRATARDPLAFLKTCRREGVTVLNQTPSAFYPLADGALNDADLALRYVIFGGEALQPARLAQFAKRFPQTQLVNMYGITETCVHVTFKKITAQDMMENSKDIGGAIPSLALYICDQAGNLLPPGVPGELMVAGAGVARGYLNRPALTAERFLDDPRVPGQRMYRSGDLACLTAQGCLNYLGRIDHQVQVRGFRVELGEVTARLQSHPKLRDAVVTAYQDEAGITALAAYFTAPEAPDNDELYHFLLDFLPEYMVPSTFTHMEAFPLTVNGKLDLSALPAPGSQLPTNYSAPQGETETLLVAIWSEILGTAPEHVSVTANFFQMGGHSLKAALMVAAIHKRFHKRLSLGKVFEQPVIRALAGLLDSMPVHLAPDIEPAPIKPAYRLSSAQGRLFLLQQMAPQSTGFNVPFFIAVKGCPDVPRLEASLKQMLERHEILRTAFFMEGETPVQRVFDAVDFRLIHLLERERPDALSTFVQPFDLERAPLMRAALLARGPEDHVLMLDMHHLVTDGLSQALFLKELAQVYAGGTLSPLRLQYKDYAEWQQHEDDRMEEQAAYWTACFEALPPALQLPADFTRPSVQTLDGATFRFALDQARTERLRHLAATQATSLFTILLGAYAALLRKLGAGSDLVIGTPVAGRTAADLEHVMGMFVNMLPLRLRLDGSQSFAQWFQTLHRQLPSAYAHQDFPFEELVRRLDVPRDVSRHPLFDTVFSLNQTMEEPLPSAGLCLQPLPLEGKTAKYDLMLVGSEAESGLTFVFEYATALFRQETVERFAAYFTAILDEILENPQGGVGNLALPTAEERARLAGFNHTAEDFGHDRLVHQRFESQAALAPNRMALVDGGQTLTYGELNRQANLLAARLNEMGAGDGTVVAIAAPRSAAAVTAMLAVLKCGAAYLPLDIKLPAKRIQSMLTEAAVTIVLHDAAVFPAELGLHSLKCLSLAEGSNGNTWLENRPSPFQPQRPAYVIFTSGSTGNPKGVCVSHGALLNFLSSMAADFASGFTAEDRCLSLTNLAFDVSVAEIFLPLCHGATLVLYRDQPVFDCGNLVDTLCNQHISFTYLPPGILTETAERLHNRRNELVLNKMLVGVEPIRDHVLRRFLDLRPHLEIVNGYGPTEATICATRYRYRPGDPQRIIPIGKPFANTCITLLDEDDQPVPPGVAGELCIAGEGLALGYVNQTELTAQRFAANPQDGGARMYRTGDLARWDQDGNLHFMGRMDEQVKLRGYRIELGEIETVLHGHFGVRQARVLLNKDKHGTPSLCAYVIAEGSPDPEGWRAFLAERLPEYMVPAAWVCLDRFPTTANGKLDRQRLPQAQALQQEELQAPRDAVESELRVLWADILDLDPESIGIGQSFFHLGGHSLKISQLARRIERRFGTRLGLVDLFTHPQIAAQAGLIRAGGEGSFQAIPPAGKADHYPLTSGQQRLFVLQQMESSSVTYNLPLAVMLTGAVDAAKVEAVLRRLVRIHEPLRTHFTWVGDRPRQVVLDGAHFHLEQGRIPADQVRATLKRFVRPFDLAQAPLFRAGLFALEDGRHLLVLDMHHIIADGVSLSLLIGQFSQLWQGGQVAHPPLSYKDYALFTQSEVEQERLAGQQRYWLEKMGGDLPSLDLPLDFPRPAARSFEGATCVYDLDSRLSQRLRALADREGTTLFQLLFAAFGIFLSKLSGNDEIFVGTPTAGRRHAQVEDMFGMFVNTVVLRAEPQNGKRFRDYLREIRQECVTAFDHQEYQFEDLVEKLKVKRDPSRNPLFDVMFGLQNLDMPALDLPDLHLQPVSADAGIAKFDLNCLCYDHGSHISFTLQYCTKLFRAERMDRFHSYLTHILTAMAENPDVLLGEVPLLSAEERHQVLYGFNRTERPYRRDALMFEGLEAMARRQPQAPALYLDERRMSYAELNENANRLAHKLRARGVGRETPVGIIIDRTMEMVVAVYAVLKAGGSYVPMEPFLPEGRIGHILDRLAIQHLITNTDNLAKTVAVARECGFCRDLFCFQGEAPLTRANLDGASPLNLFHAEDWQDAAGTDPTPVNHADDRAYVIFTSGSTGTPKGVVVAHRPVNNVVAWVNRTFEVGNHDKMLFVASFSFDLSVYDMFGVLAAGGSLRIVPSDQIKNPRALLDIIMHEGITFWDSAPAALQQLAPFLHEVPQYGRKSRLRLALLSGDWIPVPLPDQVRQAFPDCRVVSLGGATEATIWSNYFIIDKVHPHWKSIPYGKPIQNAAYYILDDHLAPVPLGVPGDLYIGGEVLAEGYDDPERTAERFIRNPFAPGRIYKTGDRARWFDDGNMEFLGRLDHQVKIRGYRVEIGEIESRLLELEGVAETIVVARRDDIGQNSLCAYVVGNPPPVAEIKTRLALHLPEYMIPPHIMTLSHIPMTVNGKVDRKALPEPQRAELAARTAPRTQAERRLAVLWAATLHIPEDEVDIDANFFEEGGHSLKATRLIAEIHQNMGVRIPLAAFFTSATIRTLSAQLEKAEATEPAFPTAEDAPFYPAAPAQKRLFILQQRHPASTAYNMPMVFQLEGALDPERLRFCFGRLLQRHESLRTTFTMVAGEPVQIIHPSVDLAMDETVIVPGQERQAVHAFIRPFDLGTGPLLRMRLGQMGEDRCLLMLDVHHIVTDGTSMVILMREFMALYAGQQLAPLKVRYRDFAAWSALPETVQHFAQQERFWGGVLSTRPPRLALPLDHPRQDAADQRGARHSFDLEPDLAGLTQALARRLETTENTVLLAAFAVVLARICAQDDLCVGMPIAGRDRGELQGLVGMFVNTLVLRLHPQAPQSFLAFLLEVKAASLAAMDHGDTPFDLLVDRFATTDHPLFDVLFMLQNLDTLDFSLEGLRVVPFLNETQVAKFDLSFQGIPFEGGYRFHVDYRSALFEAETVVRLAGYYREVLAQVLAQPERLLAEVHLETGLFEAPVALPDMDFDF